MRFPPFLIITVLYQFFIGKSSTRNISLVLSQLYNIKVSHATVADWCKKFAPILGSIATQPIPSMDFSSDEWHADETVVKINDKKHYIWFVIDSETCFVLGCHLSPYRNSPQEHSLFRHVATHMGETLHPLSATATMPIRCLPSITSPDANYIRVESFKDDIVNNIIESFNNRFKAWYKTKRGGSFC